MSEESLFREVDEDLRADRLRNLWRRFGPYIIGAAVAVVLLVAVNEGWSWWQQSNAARSSDALYVALDAARDGDMEKALGALGPVETQGSGQYPVLGKFAEAAYLSSEGKTADAVAIYDELSGSLTEMRLRELALVLAAYDLVDSGDVNGVETRVDGLIAANSSFSAAGREALGLAQYKAGELNAALATFQAAQADPNTTTDFRARVSVYIAQLMAEGAVSAAAVDSIKNGASGSGSSAPAGSSDATTAPSTTTGSDAAAPASTTTTPTTGN